PLLSYSPPSLFSVSGCPQQQGNHTSGCLRHAMTPLVLTGANFGVSDARVLIGGRDCLNVTHLPPDPHSKLTCLLQPGSGVGLGVLLFQANGESTAEPV